MAIVRNDVIHSLVCLFFVFYLRFMEKNPPDFFLLVDGCCVDDDVTVGTWGSTDVVDCNGNVRDFCSVLDPDEWITSTPKQNKISMNSDAENSK